jgi:tetrahydromethanopterin S-methyltransferase subunit G
MAETDFDRLSRIMLDEFKRVHERFDQIDENVASLSSEVSSIHRRLAALEDAVGNITGFAKEIDHLLSRVAAIENHLGLTGHIKA